MMINDQQMQRLVSGQKFRRSLRRLHMNKNMHNRPLFDTKKNSQSASLYSSTANGADTFRSARSFNVWNAVSKLSHVPWKPSFFAFRVLRDNGQPPRMPESATPKFWTILLNGSHANPCLAVSSFQAFCTSGFSAHSTRLNVVLVTP